MEYTVCGRKIQPTVCMNEDLGSLCDAAKVVAAVCSGCCNEPLPIYSKVNRVLKTLEKQISEALMEVL